MSAQSVVDRLAVLGNAQKRDQILAQLRGGDALEDRDQRLDPPFGLRGGDGTDHAADAETEEDRAENPGDLADILSGEDGSTVRDSATRKAPTKASNPNV